MSFREMIERVTGISVALVEVKVELAACAHEQTY